MPHHPPPRAVADVPPPELADGTAVAHAWLLELVAAAPLARAADVPAARLAAEGPELCAALLRAVGSEPELARLGAGGDRARLAADAGALAGAGDPAAAVAAVGLLRRVLSAQLTAALAPADTAGAAALAERVAHVADAVAAAVLAGPPAGDALAAAEEPWLRPLTARLAGGPRPLAVLVVEAHDADRLLAAGGADAAALEAVEAAVTGAVRAADAVVRERAGRVWVVADGLDADGARALGEYVAEAVATQARSNRGPALAAVGLAVCPADGEDAAALAARADERLFAARAAGVRIAD